MTTFIFDALKDLYSKNIDISDVTFILPNKRAGIFLKHTVPEVVNKTLFSPEIISIEEFVEELSQLKKASSIKLLFEFYTVYTQLTKEEEIDSFDTFSKWAQVLLQDFNEIDRYLIPQKNIFNYLSAIQDLKHWSLNDSKTDFVKKYLNFWNKLNAYYTNFTEQLLRNKIGYQGLIYREAVENLESYIQNNTNKKHVFLGFNALNTAEETIIQELLQNDLAQMYWDIDQTFIKNPNHDAALFTRNYKNNWNYFKNNPFNWIANNYSKEKDVSVIGIPKNIGQAKYIGSILKQLKNENASLKSTAVVLGDENLLMPVLNSIPSSVDAINITMGLPLKSIPIAVLFELLFNMQRKASKAFYFKDVIAILSHQFIRSLFYINGIDGASIIIDAIQLNNLVYLSNERLNAISDSNPRIQNLIFSDWGNSVDLGIKNCQLLILEIKNNLNKNKQSNLLPLEYLFRFNELFNELSLLNSSHNHIKDIATLHSVYSELLRSETLDFHGEPLQGIQLMGMLESRVLDFETVIISSVNEGVLPSGKSNNSFIPFDVKLENNLPTYKEKDAVYTYHFYRLLQRAKTVYILYNTEADVLTGGEKSRFISQLELEGVHTIKHRIIAPIVPIIKQSLTTINKSERVLQQIKQVAEKGFSPSSLTNYIRNPIDFYYQKILNIKEYDDVDVTVAINTLGTVVHNTLEDFYNPLVGEFLTVEAIKNMTRNITKTVTKHFKNEYKEGDITKGKNLIIFEIAKRYVSNFLTMEKEDLKQGNLIKILAIETNNTVEINIPELPFPIKLTGKVDRVDTYNGITRIIDYKTGKVEQNKVELVNWDDLNTDYIKHSKSFQVLMYAYMMNQKKPFIGPVEAGIISFKNLNSGFLKFAKKDKVGRYAKKVSLISQDTLDCFYNELKKLILEVCNPDVPFTEKDV